MPEKLCDVVEKAIKPAFALLPERMSSKKALVMLIAIGLQESRLIHRRQIRGPAKGLLQFERGGGVRGVLSHSATSELARSICIGMMGTDEQKAVYDELEFSDTLAFVFGRLLLWTDPKPLPDLGDEQGAWDLYLRTWRPGKPHRNTWSALYKQALEFVEALE